MAARRSPGSGALRDSGARGMITVVLHEPQVLVNIAHVVRGMKNFGFRDLRLVNPRECEASRVEGIAHQTQDVLAREDGEAESAAAARGGGRSGCARRKRGRAGRPTVRT